MFAKTGIAGHVVSISNLEFSAPQSCDVAMLWLRQVPRRTFPQLRTVEAPFPWGTRAPWDSSAHPLHLSIHPPQNP
ncbi:hypothetical protein N656DRAFT_785812 [Canariomyces notabilis]|uniref:Uncharacterized protein n=1 Tax=Canariomyces notabilis TaxID=2074819 RepID=A0AAN6QB74_9PEZI|nr:hypothetical protein N656DRAFT_785812 [Canariomyces arenarius]